MCLDPVREEGDVMWNSSSTPRKRTQPRPWEKVAPRWQKGHSKGTNDKIRAPAINWTQRKCTNLPHHPRKLRQIPTHHQITSQTQFAFFFFFFCTAAVSDKMLTHFLGQLSGLGFLQLGDASLRLGAHDTPTPVTSDLKQTQVPSAPTKNISKHTHHHFQWPKFTVCSVTNQYLLLRHSQGIKSQSSIHRVCNMYHHSNLATLHYFNGLAHSTSPHLQDLQNKWKLLKTVWSHFNPNRQPPAQPQPCTPPPPPN